MWSLALQRMTSLFAVISPVRTHQLDKSAAGHQTWHIGYRDHWHHTKTQPLILPPLSSQPFNPTPAYKWQQDISLIVSTYHLGQPQPTLKQAHTHTTITASLLVLLSLGLDINKLAPHFATSRNEDKLTSQWMHRTCSKGHREIYVVQWNLSLQGGIKICRVEFQFAGWYWSLQGGIEVCSVEFQFVGRNPA